MPYPPLPGASPSPSSSPRRTSYIAPGVAIDPPGAGYVVKQTTAGGVCFLAFVPIDALTVRISHVEETIAAAVAAFETRAPIVAFPTPNPEPAHVAACPRTSPRPIPAALVPRCQTIERPTLFELLGYSKLAKLGRLRIAVDLADPDDDDATIEFPYEA